MFRGCWCQGHGPARLARSRRERRPRICHRSASCDLPEIDTVVARAGRLIDLRVGDLETVRTREVDDAGRVRRAGFHAEVAIVWTSVAEMTGAATAWSRKVPRGASWGCEVAEAAATPTVVPRKNDSEKAPSTMLAVSRRIARTRIIRGQPGGAAGSGPLPVRDSWPSSSPQISDARRAHAMASLGAGREPHDHDLY
jgi:hypothetical protein